MHQKMRLTAGLGAPPGPAGGACSALPDPPAGLKGRGGERGRSGKWEGEETEWEMEEEGKGRRKGEDPPIYEVR